MEDHFIVKESGDPILLSVLEGLYVCLSIYSKFLMKCTFRNSEALAGNLGQILHG